MNVVPIEIGQRIPLTVLLDDQISAEERRGLRPALMALCDVLEQPPEELQQCSPVAPFKESSCSVIASEQADPVAPVIPEIDWRDIPVFIVNRNRFGAMRRLVDWLLQSGTRRVVILDNASTYPPLLQYYEELPDGASVLRLPDNQGPHVLWKEGVHRVLDKPFVLTDSDVVPDESCPQDLIGRMLDILRQHPDARKVGPGLRIDDLPEHYGEADIVRKWESRFWERPVAPGLFRAPIDTTFALYPPGSEFTNDECNLRLGAPYLLVHTPWYVDECNLSEEEKHYRENTSLVHSNWSVAKKDLWVARSHRVVNYESRPKVLNVDGGSQRIPGWINAGLDFPFDPANCRLQEMPVPEGSLDGIYLSHVLEGVSDPWPLFEQLWVAAKPGAKLFIREPHGSRLDAWKSPRQRRAWSEGSFALLSRLHQHFGTNYSADWEVVSVTSIVEASTGESRELVAVLKAIKPARSPGSRIRHSAPAASRKKDDLVDPDFEVVTPEAS